ncbi:MAG: NADPH-dependent F420 reductase [Anaerolinea sp.]|nr:NADPH-dependent F420 reductase [Anaerolinea sp.]
MAERIALIGGTGKEGKGLAFRWAKAGYDVVIGSRQIEKAQIAADELNLLLGNVKNPITGLQNFQATDWCDIAVLTVPFSAHQAILTELKDCLTGKIMIDVTVPLVPPKVSKVQMPAAGSAALEARDILGEGIQIVSAFQNISYERLMEDGDIECDVLVTGTSKDARKIVLELVKKAGMVGWDAGPIENSVVAEGLTSVLIGINNQFGIHNAGIKITGINRE